mgnify:CR=1 FL=1
MSERQQTPVNRNTEPAVPLHERPIGRRTLLAAVILAMPVVEQLRLSRAWQQDADAASQLAAESNGARGQRMLERFWVAYVVFFVAALPLMLTGTGLVGFQFIIVMPPRSRLAVGTLVHQSGLPLPAAVNAVQLVSSTPPTSW